MKLKILFSSIVLMWLIGFIYFLYDLSSNKKIASIKCDAVVVLTGGKNRINTGFTLLSKNLGKKLFISGVNKNVSIKEIKKNILNKYPNNNVELGHTANDTLENAKETSIWMKKNNYKSLYLVTTSYHMRRSLIEFKKSMPSINIIPHSVPFKKEKIWNNTFFLAKEYNKFLYSIFRYYL